MSQLLELAQRCEAATGPDRELDGAIHAAAVRDQQTYWGPANEKLVRNPIPHFTASLDAAMTLIPDGHVWTLDGGYTRAMNSAEVGREPTGGELMQPIAQGEGETAALALCAAALKARHQSGDGDNG